MRCDSPHGTLRYQSRRSLVSADPPEGTTHAPIQICWPGSTRSLPPRFRPESFPRRPPLAPIDESPTLTIAILPGLADRDSGLRRLQDIPTITTPKRPRPLKLTMPAQLLADPGRTALRRAAAPTVESQEGSTEKTRLCHQDLTLANENLGRGHILAL